MWTTLAPLGPIPPPQANTMAGVKFNRLMTKLYNFPARPDQSSWRPASRHWHRSKKRQRSAAGSHSRESRSRRSSKRSSSRESSQRPRSRRMSRMRSKSSSSSQSKRKPSSRSTSPSPPWEKAGCVRLSVLLNHMHIHYPTHQGIEWVYPAKLGKGGDCQEESRAFSLKVNN